MYRYFLERKRIVIAESEDKMTEKYRNEGGKRGHIHDKGYRRQKRQSRHWHQTKISDETRQYIQKPNSSEVTNE